MWFLGPRTEQRRRETQEAESERQRNRREREMGGDEGERTHTK